MTCKCKDCESNSKCRWSFDIMTCCGCEATHNVDGEGCPYIMFPRKKEEAHMKINFLKIKGDWQEVKDAAMTTIGKDAGHIPSSEWKRRMLLCEHSPIRKLIVKWKWSNLLWWVQTHFTRHHVGVEWHVSTSRTDRTGIDRTEEGSQSNLISVEGEANAQAIINISRKRLCMAASKETREAWLAFLAKLKRYEPELVSISVPDCIYRGHCYEYMSCGYFKTPEYKLELEKYRKGINNETIS